VTKIDHRMTGNFMGHLHELGLQKARSPGSWRRCGHSSSIAVREGLLKDIRLSWSHSEVAERIPVVLSRKKMRRIPGPTGGLSILKPAQSRKRGARLGRRAGDGIVKSRFAAIAKRPRSFGAVCTRRGCALAN